MKNKILEHYFKEIILPLYECDLVGDYEISSDIEALKIYSSGKIEVPHQELLVKGWYIKLFEYIKEDAGEIKKFHYSYQITAPEGITALRYDNKQEKRNKHLTTYPDHKHIYDPQKAKEKIKPLPDPTIKSFLEEAEDVYNYISSTKYVHNSFSDSNNI